MLKIVLELIMMYISLIISYTLIIGFASYILGWLGDVDILAYFLLSLLGSSVISIPLFGVFKILTMSHFLKNFANNLIVIIVSSSLFSLCVIVLQRPYNSIIRLFVEPISTLSFIILLIMYIFTYILILVILRIVYSFIKNLRK